MDNGEKGNGTKERREGETGSAGAGRGTDGAREELQRQAAVRAARTGAETDGPKIRHQSLLLFFYNKRLLLLLIKELERQLLFQFYFTICFFRVEREKERELTFFRALQRKQNRNWKTGSKEAGRSPPKRIRNARITFRCIQNVT
jgi:hypothetical protein